MTVPRMKRRLCFIRGRQETAASGWLTGKTAAKLLEKGKAPLKGCVSPRTGQVYDATVLLEDDGTRPSFKLVFGNG